MSFGIPVRNGLGLGLLASTSLSTFNSGFTPLSLFAANEPGAWYDPSDLTTLFQDSAGTTPVTAVEQPVGRMLDKSGRGNNLTQSTTTARPVLSARINVLVNTATLSTQSVTTLATNYTLRFEGTGSIALSGTASGTYSAGSHTVTCTAGTLTLTVTGTVTNADLRVTNEGVGLPVYQRVGVGTPGSSTVAGSSDYDTTGFPLYLKFDGTDDFMVSSTITPGIDKAQVFAGVRKLTTATFPMIAEMGVNADTLPAINLYSNSTDDKFTFNSRGSGSVATSAAATASIPPASAVLTGIGSISEDISQVRVNGVFGVLSTTDQGSGNYSPYPLYVGSRAGSSLRFNGRLYSLTVRFGANLSTDQISSMETYVNNKTKAYTP